MMPAHWPCHDSYRQWEYLDVGSCDSALICLVQGVVIVLVCSIQVGLVYWIAFYSTLEARSPEACPVK